MVQTQLFPVWATHKPNPNQGAFLIVQRVRVSFSFPASLKSALYTGNITVRPGREGWSQEMRSQQYQLAILSVPAASFVKWDQFPT